MQVGADAAKQENGSIMRRSHLILLAALLALLSGAAWLLNNSPGSPGLGDLESAFDFDEAEELPEPGAAMVPGALERSAAIEAPAAPASAGSAVDLSQKTSFDRPTLRGRRVDAQGTPLPANTLYVLEYGARWTRGNYISEDISGVFHFFLIPEGEEDPGSWICLQHLGSGDDPAPAPETYVFARAVDPVTRLQDVGDLVRGAGPTAVAGIVADLDRRPLAGARVEVLWSLSGKEGGASVFSALTDADGRFHLLGTWPDIGKWSVKGSHGEHLPVTLPIAPGAAHVEILLPRGSALRGKILVDPEISLERLTVKVRARRDGQSHWEQNLELKPDPKTGEFAATGLRSGWGRIRVYDNQMKWNLHFQYGIPLPSGHDAQVPELQPLDLRGRLKNFKLTALQPDGSLAEGLRIVVHDKKTYEISIPNPLECVVPSQTIELILTAKDCSEQKVFITGAEQTIRLEKSPRIAFLLGPQPPLEEGFSLTYRVSGAEGTAGNWNLKWDETGRAELALTPGNYTVSAMLLLRQGERNTVTSVPCAPDGDAGLNFVVGQDSSPGLIRVSVDPALVQDRITRLRPAPPR